MLLKCCKNVIATQNIKHAYIVLSCIAYIFKRGFDSSKADLLKKALHNLYRDLTTIISSILNMTAVAVEDR